MIDKKGGPAFPVLGGGFAKLLEGEAMVGMTLRDYFAAKALRGLFDIPSFDGEWSQIAKDAYALADAMLAERDK